VSTSDEFLAAVKANDGPTVERLLAADPALAASRDANGVSALLLALYHGHADLAARLAAPRSDLDPFEAAALGDRARLAALLDEGTHRADAVSPDGFPLVTLAAFFGRPEALALLLARGADPDAAAANPMRVAAVHAAAAHRDGPVALAMMRLLLERGARVNVAQQGGWTPLHQAAKHGPAELVELLLVHDADVGARSDDGQTPLALAEAAGQSAIAALLRERGATA
jgi:ankyrin repeat protein